MAAISCRAALASGTFRGVSSQNAEGHTFERTVHRDVTPEDVVLVERDHGPISSPLDCDLAEKASFTYLVPTGVMLGIFASPAPELITGNLLLRVACRVACR